ncbi:SDR family oxidoreductase [Bordetella petrii]|uniref:SDR family oxidoreductase n=1 Tax=Bordetella petrii TaxID=94624 RepID=UPI001E410243|nr:SDR family oxidoreductase [Bordetella petrii]MCD0504440.1 SDR family oxidoreductase [Bordetella petrii]
MMEHETLAGRVVLVAGGAGGLGAAICAMLGAEGASVVVADIDRPGAERQAQRLNEAGASAHAAAMDIGSEPQVAAALGSAVERYGKLDAVVNSAGIDAKASVADLDLATWERVLRTNLTGPFLLAKLAGQRLVPGGHVVNIVSATVRRTWPDASAYHASQWGLMGLSHALHAELRGMGLKVSAVIAGRMRTPFMRDRYPGLDDGCQQDPENVARAVRFVLTQPGETVVPEVRVEPMQETPWP